MSDNIEIHLLQLPKWQSPQIETEKERWIYLFKEGKNVDVDTPPEVLHTDEMRQAMEVLNRFSENQDDYLLYQSRLDAILKENTLVSEMARVKRENEQVKREREQARKKEEQARKREEQVQAKLDSLLLHLKERGMDDVVAEVSKEK